MVYDIILVLVLFTRTIHPIVISPCSVYLVVTLLRFPFVLHAERQVGARGGTGQDELLLNDPSLERMLEDWRRSMEMMRMSLGQTR